MKKERILEAIKQVDDSDIVMIWNEFCDRTNRNDDRIMDVYEMEEWAREENVTNVLNRFYFGCDEGNKETSANPNRNYFMFNGYGNIISFDYIYNSYSQEFYNIYVDEMIEYIIENNDSLYSDFIQEILDDESDEE